MSSGRTVDDALARIADAAIRHVLETGNRDDPSPDGLPAALSAPGACFVTLLERGRLQGCIGSIEPRRPLWLDVARNAVAAAFDDPRLPPLTAAQFARTNIEISLLGPLERLDAPDRETLLATLRPDVDGLLVTAAGTRAVFLPSVWAQLPEPDDFVRALWAKGGLAATAWPAGIRLDRFGVRVVHDPAPRPPVRPRC